MPRLQVSLLFVLTLMLVLSAPLHASDTFRDCQDCPIMVVIPAGTGVMGSTMEEAEREHMPMMGANDISAWERPRHTVTISRAFAMGQYEVTRSEYAFFIANSGYRPRRGCSTVTDQGNSAGENNAWDDPGFPQTGDHPVVCVSWTDAYAYTDWLSQYTGQTYRLPSEAEWEYAARGGTETARHWGDGIADACAYANGADESHLAAYTGRTFLDTYLAAGGAVPARLEMGLPCDDGFVETAPVGSFRPNSFGLYDMLGNVWESVMDCPHFNYEGAPADGSAWMDPASCNRAPPNFSELIRVFRGGAFSYPPYGLRSARRGWGGHDRRTWNRGFRVVREMD